MNPVLLPAGIRYRMSQTFHPAPDALSTYDDSLTQSMEGSASGRIRIWRGAIAMIKDRPLFGHGPNTFMTVFQGYRSNAVSLPTYAHNCYLQIAAETGLPSLACFLAFLFFYFRNGLLFLRKEGQTIRARELLGVLSGLLNFLILGMIDTIFHNPQVVMGFWFLAGWGIACQNRLRQAACEGTAKKEGESLGK